MFVKHSAFDQASSVVGHWLEIGGLCMEIVPKNDSLPHFAWIQPRNDSLPHFASVQPRIDSLPHSASVQPRNDI